MAHDVIVVGAGLAGLAAARDLMLDGADVVVLEARARPGGRVDQIVLEDGRPVQLGGELIGEFHTAYLQLADELGLTPEPLYDGRGQETTLLADGTVHVGDSLGWMSDADRASYVIANSEFGKLVRSVDPADPWAHPDAERLDRISVGMWLRSIGATPAVVRARELFSAAGAGGSVDRTSLLASLRMEAAAKSHAFYDYGVWETMRLREGSATLAWRMAEQLATRVRYGSPVRAIEIATPRCAVTTVAGERLEAEAVVSAVPTGPLRDLHIAGVSTERIASLHRQRNAFAAKAVFVYDESFWSANEQTGSSSKEIGILGGTWPQRDGILSALIGPERFAPLLATAAEFVQAELVEEVAQLFGEQARGTRATYLRHYGADPYTQGYVTEWRPGDVLAVGPLHGTHEPPFFVCGSDQWVAGYMEGAVRTGRSAAAAALGRELVYA